MASPDPWTRLPLDLARRHATLEPGAIITVQPPAPPIGDGGDQSGNLSPQLPPRWPDIVDGAGFEFAGRRVDRLRRLRTLADVVGPGMRLLIVGLNPSPYAADAGVGFARPGNRFWPAALAAGIASADRDPFHALEHHGTGFTDLVKRPTVGAAELTRHEYREGAQRVERLVAWLAPGVVCFAGLAGWRAAVDRRAEPGFQPGDFGGRPAYVMPNPSGLNAHVNVGDLAAHLRAASGQNATHGRTSGTS